MRRYIKPFNGNRYVLNKSTGEIHDLDNEQALCHIDEMDPNNVVNCVTYEDAVLRAIMLNSKNPNGCHYCLISKDNG